MIQSITILPSSEFKPRSCILAERQFNIFRWCISHGAVEFYSFGHFLLLLRLMNVEDCFETSDFRAVMAVYGGEDLYWKLRSEVSYNIRMMSLRKLSSNN